MLLLVLRSPSLHDLVNQVPLDFFWCAEAEEKCTRDSLQNVKAVSVSVKATVTGSSVGLSSCLSGRFVCFSGASSFLLLTEEDGFASAAVMKKHSKNPFILPISPTKGSCARLTDRRAFT